MPPVAATGAERGQGLWLSSRVMDLEAHGHRDMVGVPGALSPLARVEGLAKLALEPSGTGTPGHPARGTSHYALAALQVAGHKKKPEDLGPISRSLTKAAFGSSPRVVGPGPLRDRRRSSATATNMIASRRWLPSRCRPSASIWGCGIKGRFTRGLRLQRSGEPTLATISKSSRSTPPNSTLSSSSGTTLRVHGEQPAARHVGHPPQCAGQHPPSPALAGEIALVHSGF
jgi:hypothetical protein